MTIKDQELPEFAMAMRGYDRIQVDDYVQRLVDYAAELETRALTAESELARARDELETARRKLHEAGGGTLPERLAHILDTAEEEAGDIKARARGEAEQILREADRRRRDEEAHVQQIVRRRVELLDSLAEVAKQVEQAVDAHRARAASSDETQPVPTTRPKRNAPERAKAG